MLKPRLSIQFARSLILCVLLTGPCVGHATIVHAENAKIIAFGKASSADLSRYWTAMDRWHGALFPELPPPSVAMGQFLPILKLSIQSKHELFDSLEPGPRSATLYLCGGPDRKWGIDGTVIGNILWEDKFVDQETSYQIAGQLKAAAKPQEYEIYFSYAYWDPTAAREKKNQITLLPLPDDICLTFEQPPVYSVSSSGEVLRTVELLIISKEAVDNAMGKLPQLVTVP